MPGKIAAPDNNICVTEHKIGNITYVIKSRPSENAARTLSELAESLIAIELNKTGGKDGKHGAVR